MKKIIALILCVVMVAAVFAACAAEEAAQEAVETYKNYVLSSGGSDSPVELLKLAGVDLTKKDAFTAAMTLRYLENGGDILDAVRFGNVVGGISVSRPGAGESIPTLEEAEHYLATHSGRY